MNTIEFITREIMTIFSSSIYLKFLLSYGKRSFFLKKKLYLLLYIFDYTYLYILCRIKKMCIISLSSKLEPPKELTTSTSAM